MSEAFFSDGFKELHRDVVNHLTSDSLHACLPLLAVSKSWRLLAAERIVHDFEERKKALGGGQYLKVYLSTLCPQEGAHKEDDPRYSFTREARHLPSLSLWFDSIDYKTTMCSFKPASRKGEVIYYNLACDESGREFSDVARAFCIASSAWFQPAPAGKVLFGLELAACPTRHPSCWPDLCPDHAGPPPKNLKGKARAEACKIAKNDEKLHNGWIISYETHRGLTLGRRGGFLTDVEARLVVHELRVPVIHLLVPPETRVAKDYYSDY